MKALTDYLEFESFLIFVRKDAIKRVHQVDLIGNDHNLLRLFKTVFNDATVGQREDKWIYR
ncbi:hypothetical protein GCM10011409_39400 [Lentibacillus populi]|uniref:Uncharacterized protein n=1 Tax=Lentibacillus populi TaxID=1827502 RepID=A0A9W5U0X8_9BACI|nr:hypothetical protein [Lentibacillus populi]MBT2215531.1 hypothetical protein [Virgibacillus dakarensis]GGB58021.1 hypothetical protein GCM10011409_39400 [Lentibacillus populi]